MFRSLRFRLPAFFLAGVALAGIVSTAIAVQLFQQHIRSQSLSELKREARGLTELYQEAALRSIDEGRSAPQFGAGELEQATGTRLFYVGAPVFFRGGSGLHDLSYANVGGDRWQTLVEGKKVITFDFTPPGEHKTFLAVGQPLQLKGQNFGALVVAKKKTELRRGGSRSSSCSSSRSGSASWWPGSSPGTSPAGSPGRCWHSPPLPTRSRPGPTTSTCPTSPGAAR